MKTTSRCMVLLSSLIIVLYSCSKSDSSPNDNTGGNDNSIQKQIVDTKWYYDSTVYWRADYGFSDILDFNGYNQKSYLFFGADSTMTEYHWTGITYEQTSYPYVWEGNVLKCDYDAIHDFPSVQIKSNQLIFGDVATLPRQTDTTGQVELLWWFYHK